jgi:hypothetical protein
VPSEIVGIVARTVSKIVSAVGCSVDMLTAS